MSIVVGGFNTAIERFADGNPMKPGEVARVDHVRVWPGGKGLHVAQAAAALGGRVRLVGIIDEMHERWFDAFLKSRGVEFRGVRVAGDVRTCLAIRHPDGGITEILEPGPTLSDEEQQRLMRDYVESARAAAVSILSGSVPAGMPQDVYASAIAGLAQSQTRVLLDASGERLRLGIAARPFMIKPNRREAEELSGRTIRTTDDAIAVARELGRRGLHLVVISLGAEGLVAAWEDRVYSIAPPVLKAVNTVGAGDCLLGGIAVGLARGLGEDDVLRHGAAAGAAKVLTEETGMLDPSDFERIYDQIRVTRH